MAIHDTAQDTVQPLSPEDSLGAELAETRNVHPTTIHYEPGAQTTQDGLDTPHDSSKLVEQEPETPDRHESRISRINLRRRGKLAAALGAAASVAIAVVAPATTASATTQERVVLELPGRSGGDSQESATRANSSQESRKTRENSNRFGSLTKAEFKSLVANWTIEGQVNSVGQPNGGINFPSESNNQVGIYNQGGLVPQTMNHLHESLRKISEQQTNRIPTENLQQLRGLKLVLSAANGQVVEVDNPIVYTWESNQAAGKNLFYPLNHNYPNLTFFYPTGADSFASITLTDKGVGYPSQPGTLLRGVFVDKDSGPRFVVGAASIAAGENLVTVNDTTTGEFATTQSKNYSGGIKQVTQDILNASRDYTPLNHLWDALPSIRGTGS